MRAATGTEKTTLRRVTAETAAEANPDIELSDEAEALLRDEHEPGQYLSLLMEAELLDDAIRFLARALPKTLAVRWALDCTREAQGEPPTEVEKECLETTERWLEKPSEENRRAANDAAEAAQYNSAPALAAAAAAWSGGSLGPPEFDSVPPAEKLTAEAAAGALILASTSGEPLEVADRQKSYLTTGIALAEEPPKGEHDEDPGSRTPGGSGESNGWGRPGNSGPSGGQRGGW